MIYFMLFGKLFGTNIAKMEESPELLCIICMHKFQQSDIIKKCNRQCAANFHVSCWNNCMSIQNRCPHCRSINYITHNITSPTLITVVPPTPRPTISRYRLIMSSTDYGETTELLEYSENHSNSETNLLRRLSIAFLFVGCIGLILALINDDR